MAPMNNFFRAARPVFRNTFFTSNAARNGGKRFQSTASSEQAQESFFKRMWNSPVGFKTVHFWYVFCTIYRESFQVGVKSSITETR